jgi:hypothetical protein
MGWAYADMVRFSTGRFSIELLKSSESSSFSLAFRISIQTMFPLMFGFPSSLGLGFLQARKRLFLNDGDFR